MNKFAFFIFLLVLITIFKPVEAALITVCSSGCDSTTVQGGINLASNGDEVRITDSGSYREAVNVNKSVNLTSNSTIKPLVWFNETSNTITIAVNNTNISNLNIKQNRTFDAYHGIYANSKNNVNIVFNNITVSSSLGRGVYLTSSYNNTISNNNITTTSSVVIEPTGIQMTSSYNNTISNNNIITNRGYGISGSNSTNNILSNINVTTSGSEAFGISLTAGSTNNILSNINVTTSGIIGVGLHLSSSDSNNITSSNINSISSGDLYFISSSNIIFLDTNYTDEQLSSSDLKRYWYLDVYVTNYSGDQVYQANVSAWDNSNNKLFSELTNLTGYIIRKELMQYNQTGSTKTYYTNFTINATKSGYPLDNTSINLTNSMTLQLILDYPQYTAVSVSPASGASYISAQTYIFQSIWTDSDISNVILEFSGVNYSYLSAGLSKTGNLYSKTLTGLSIGTYNYRWFASDTSNNWNSTPTYTYQVVSQTTPPTITPPPSAPVNLPPPQNPTEFPPTVIDLPEIKPGAPITMPPSGITVKLEPNFVLTVYPLTNTTAVVHNLSKIEEPGKYKILLCNQTLISSYEINITADLTYYCANYSGYPIDEPTINIFRFKENNWIPLITGNLIRNNTKKVICGKIESTPYMITGFNPTVTSETAMIAINDVNNTISLAKRQNINVTEATLLMNKALYEYYSCNYINAKALADKALDSLVKVKIPEWVLYVAFVLIVIIGLWYYKIVRQLKHQI